MFFLNWSLHSDIKWPALCWSELGYPVFFWPISWKLANYVTSCVALYLLPKPFRQNTIVKEKKNQCKMSEWLHTLCHLLFQLKFTNSTSKLMISVRYYVQTIKDLVSKRKSNNDTKILRTSAKSWGHEIDITYSSRSKYIN